MSGNEWDEKGISNNQECRNISNVLDSIPFFKYSRTRARIHAIYHAGIAAGKLAHGNAEGAKNEAIRAAQQGIKAQLGFPFTLLP